MANELAVNTGPLSRFEAATDPSPVFANRLEAAFLAAAMSGETVAVVTARPAEIGRPVIRMRSISNRRKLLDLEAVAALLLAMIGGLASTTQRSSAPASPTAITAPEEDLPTVQYGGTAAQDNQFPGPAPVSGTPEMAWQLPGGAAASYYPMLMSGEYLYAIHDDGSDAFYRPLTAFDASDGTVMWQRSVSSWSELAATSVGVVALIVPENAKSTPTNAKNPPYDIALLDRDTGKTIWEVDRVFDGKADAYGYHLIVEGANLYLVDRSGLIVALDLATGAERWLYSFKRELAAGFEDRICWAFDESDCQLRTDYFMPVAITANTVFVADAATMTIRAIDAASGDERWVQSAQDVHSSTAVIAPFGVVTTADDNVVYAVQQTTADFTSELPSQFVVSGASGDTLSSSTMLMSMVAASDGHQLFGQMMVGDQYAVASVENKTGELLWFQPINAGSVIGYLASDKTVVVQEYDAPRRTWGLDATTGDIKWEVSQGANTCQITFPLSSDGLAVCWGGSDGPVVARISPSDTRTVSASPVAADDYPGPYQVNGDATGGSQIRGLPISDASYQPIWAADSNAIQTDDPFATVYRYNVYSTSSAQADGTTYLMARDLGSGDLIWQTQISTFAPYMVTSSGVVTLVQDRFDSTILRVAVLASADGRIVKLSDATFAAPDAWGQLGVNVTGNTILVSDRTGHVAALDFSSGQQRWAYDYDRVLAPGLTIEPTCNACMFNREDRGPIVTSDGETVYVSDYLTATLTALDIATGEVIWSRNLLEIVPPEEFIAAYSVATERGPLVVISRYPVGAEMPAETLALWSARDGSEIWSTDALLGQYPVLTGGDSFYFAASKSSLVGTPVPITEQCCAVAWFSLVDGSMIWQQKDDVPRIVIGYLAEWDQIVVMNWGTETIGDEVLEGWDAVTHQVLWTFALDSQNCSDVLFPVGPSGVILCTTESGQLTVLGPVEAREGPGTPIASPEP